MNSILKQAAICLIVLTAATAAMAADRIGKIKVASGEVTITRGGETIVAESGGDLFEQDVIMTGANSAIGMTFDDNSRVSLGPESSLVLESYAHNASGKQDTFDLRIRHGSLTAASGDIAKSRPLAMRVLMPTTVLGVKGTEFAVRVARK